MPGLFRHPTIHQRLRSWYVGPRNKSGVTHRCRRIIPSSPPPRAWPSALSYTPDRSEEHTSELQSLMRISYAVFCLKKKNKNNNIEHITKSSDHILSNVRHNNNDQHTKKRPK